ncbi:MarR family winged helix-turn-helix transcriptional regulator [Thermogemmatispora sp.]|jgi:DNA-binding MarR family transcriptional regulator|uniref:MarR family winged helix-turn-helix transcriptional regulator n=1 Tax=Thermogemmatispora sp. TaxID=1968838 RepID=UPI0035E40B7D
MERETDGERELGRDLEEQAERFASLFSRIQRVMGASFKRAHQQGTVVGTTQFMVLGLLQRALQEGGEPYTIGLLASRLDLDPATVVRAVDSLERRGLVIRRRDRQDRRQVFVEFTDSGRELRQQMAQQMKEQLKSVFSLMSEEGRFALLRGLEELAGVIAERAEREGETHGRHGC